MLKKVRIVLAVLFFIIITLLFLDFTGTIHRYFSWMASIQLIPAILALNLIIIAGLVAITLVFGRLYCSVICPMGVMQDVISWLSGKRKGKKYRFTYSNEKKWLRLFFLALFIITMTLGGGAIGALLAPYSSYGRIVANLMAPVYNTINNIFAYFAERIDSYAFYSVEVQVRSWLTLAVAAITLIVIFIFAWRNGRSYCNTVCPVGTVLGFLSRYSYFKPHIDTSKCIGCKICSRACKASCIDAVNHKIDYSRCVSCMDCIDNCTHGAIKFCHKTAAKTSADNSLRQFLAVTGVAVATAAIHAEEKKVDGGLAVIEDKKIPNRNVPIIPGGAISLNNFTNHCTACQLCVSACPNGVLKPSHSLERFMQPEMSYENGFCRPECTLCADVCPTDAIRPLPKEEKMMHKIGTAKWIKENCIILQDGVECGNCERHCPNGAIKMISMKPKNPKAQKFPVVNSERCIGCGACEYVCPARPFSAIYVEGIEVHRTI